MNKLKLNDAIGPRLRVAILASIFLNVLLWRSVAGLTQRPLQFITDRINVTRVIMDKQGKTVEKKVIPKVIPKKEPKPIVEPERKQVAQYKEPPRRSAILTAKPNPLAPAKPEDHTADATGNNKVGNVIGKQDAGPVAPDPPKADPPKPDPPKAEPPKADPPKADPPKADPPKVDPPKVDLPKVDPPKADPPPPPKAKGPSREAQYDAVKPDIPDELKKGEYKAFVRVKVEVNEDGSYNPIIRVGSGNAEIDRRVLEALKHWKWKPALKDGIPVKSTQLFKFEFLVE